MKKLNFESGIVTFEFEGWDDFLKYSTDKLDYTHYIWRGQRDSDWPLESTLDRALKGLTIPKRIRETQTHYDRFQYATRGRRGSHPVQYTDKDEWWALGQHYGLNTPLLDWSRSIFVASFFAYESSIKSSTGFRAIYGLSRNSVETKCKEIKEAGNTNEIVKFVDPLIDDNLRLVNQNGLFTLIPPGIILEEWIKQHFANESKKIRLQKLLFPEGQRVIALQSLNRMNINHLTLFPDLFGACKYANLNLEISKY